jgi:hypothetical protein
VTSIKNYKNHQRAYTERVDIVIIAMIKSLRFVPKSDAAHTGWLAFDWTEITEPVTLPQVAGGKKFEISGFHTIWQWRKNIQPSAIVVDEYADARRTEAVKLSVKLLSGLTLIALVAVAVIGLSHSASAAVDAKVYVTNKASGLTTEPSTAVLGRTSATTVYGTYASYVSTGKSARDIVANSDRFIVTVIDADLNATKAVTSNETANGGYNVSAAGTDVTNASIGTGFNAPGERVQITLTDEVLNPVVGSVSDIKVRLNSSGAAVPGVSVLSIDYAGDGANYPALITLQRDFGTSTLSALDIGYPTSEVDVTTVTIKSVVYTGVAAVLTLTETGRNTGRFEGEVLVRERVPAFVTGLPGAGSVGDPSEIPAIGGPITVSYVDAVTTAAATNVTRTASYKIDVTVPTATISSPATASESQSRLPTFTGTVTDNQSGLDVSAFSLNIDDVADQANANPVISFGGSRSTEAYPGTASPPTIIGKVASIDVTALKDGIASLPFTYAETVTLPLSTTNPDHIVDFQVRAADLAGNYGYSDASSTKGNDGTGRHGNQPHTIKIDQIIPQIASADTGKAWDTTVTTPVEKSNVYDSIVVRFDGNVKEDSIQASDFEVVFSGAGGTYVPVSAVVVKKDVYLDLDVTIPSNNKPTVKINGAVEDLAGNSTTAGSKVASDTLAPVVTAVRSGGSGTGTTTEAADSLTKDKMTITVTSDETLQGPPAIYVTDINADLTPVSTVGNVNNGTLGVSQGGNVWSLVVAKGTSAAGIRAVKVIATDSGGTIATVGKDNVKAYTLDLALSNPASSPSATTTQSNPFLTTDYAATNEASTVTIVSATLDAVDVTTELVPSADNKTFFFQPLVALTNASHKYIVKAKDAAGNTWTETTTFTKSDRTDFVIQLFAGWNSVSVPSSPIDTDVNTVLSNTGIKQVVAYDATTPSQPWRIASKVGSAAFTSGTTPGLTTITAGAGYWIETSNFEDQKVALEGPTGPGDARPGLTTIATGNGWNLVGVVDQSRTQTQKGNNGTTLSRPNNVGADTPVVAGRYFNTVNDGRAYVFNTVSSKFRELDSSNPLTIGSGIWVFISPQTNGELPHIVP